MASLKLPTKYQEPESEFTKYHILLHGEKKIGKTQLSQQTGEDKDGKVLALNWDPKQRAYRRIEKCYREWVPFRKFVKFLAGHDELPYMRVVVDDVGAAYHACLTYVCEKLAIDHPADAGWGKGWAAVRDEFTRVINDLLSLPCGVWFLCHSTWKEVELPTGKKVEKLVPVLPGQAEEVLNGKVDAWFAYDWKGSDRIIWLEGSERIGAGHRISQPDEGNPHFEYTDGTPIRRITVQGSAKYAYHRLSVEAFENQLVRKQKVK